MKSVNSSALITQDIEYMLLPTTSSLSLLFRRTTLVRDHAFEAHVYHTVLYTG